MFKRVMLCYDGTVVGRRALRRGAELAIALHAEVHVLSIAPEGPADPAVAAGAAGHACLIDPADAQRKLLEESLDWLRARGVAATGHLSHGHITDQIVAHAQSLAIDLIVLGHYPQPTGGYWWTSGQRGSLAERAHCCILVAVDAPS